MGLDLDKIIETSERLDRIAEAPRQRRPHPQQSSASPVTMDELDAITNRTGSPYMPKMENKTYNPENEIERINEARARGSILPDNVPNCGLSREIVESIMRNPCMLDPTIVERKSEGEMMAEKLRQSGGASGNDAFDKMKSLMERHDAQDIIEDEVAQTRFKNKNTSYPQNLNEVAGNGQAFIGGVDYSMIKMIIENVVKEQLDSVKSALLTESRQASRGNPLSFLRITDNGIRLVDSNDNIYECKLTYIGKREQGRK